MATSTRIRATLIVVLRISTILLAAGSIVVLILDKATDPNNGSKITFKTFFAYRFVLATAVIGAAYCLLQLPSAIYYACTEKRLIRGDFLPAFDFYGDKVIAFLLATGVGAGIFVNLDLKANLDDLEDDPKPLDDFFIKGYMAMGLLAGAFFNMALLSIFTSPCQNTSRGFFR